jgi:tellurite resistance protein
MSQSVISPQSALVYLMVIIAAADSRLADQEIDAISHSISNLPVFRGFDRSALYEAAQSCSDILQEPDGLSTVLALVREAVPEGLVDTAYALACSMAASDGEAAREELRLLDIIRHELAIDRLVATAIERGVVALNRPMPG